MSENILVYGGMIIYLETPNMSYFLHEFFIVDMCWIMLRIQHTKHTKNEWWIFFL